MKKHYYIETFNQFRKWIAMAKSTNPVKYSNLYTT